MTDCRWMGTENPRALKRRHEDDCLDDDCLGCLPCPDPHCVVCGIEHKHGVCPGCLSVSRDHLDELSRLLSRVGDAMRRSTFTPRSGAMATVPAGELMYLAGPTADIEDHARSAVYAVRRASNPKHRGDADHVHDERDSDGEHPSITLLWWYEKWRALRGQVHDPRGLWEYLDDALGWAADNELQFDEFAKDLRTQVARLEDALLEGERPPVGAPCLKCGYHQIKEFGETIEKDRWRCPRCNQESNSEQYVMSEMDVRRKRATRLTATDIEATYGVKKGTLWKWVSDEDVARRGLNGDGRKMYDTADVRRMLGLDADGMSDMDAEVS